MIRALAIALLVGIVSAASAHDTEPDPAASLSVTLPGPSLPGDVKTVFDVKGNPRGLERTGQGVRCRDGDRACDHDGLRNEQCEFWVRMCLTSSSSTAIDPSLLTIANHAADPHLPILERTLAHVATTKTDEGIRVCGALARLTVGFGAGARESRKGTTRIVLAAGNRRVPVRLTCAPPKRSEDISYRRIQAEVFEKRQCATSGCHGLPNPQGGLRLDGTDSYDNLINRPALASDKLLVQPGKPDNSFLLDKLRGELGPTEGVAMPQGRPLLPAEEIEAIERWIAAGAPFNRSVKGKLRGQRLLTQPPFEPRPVAPGALRVVSGPRSLEGQPEVNDCQYVRLGNPEPGYIGRWELHMQEGGHHTAVRLMKCIDVDGNGVSDCDEPDFDSRFPHTDLCVNFERIAPSIRVGGTTENEYTVDYDTEHTGVAIPIHRNQPILLTSHFANDTYKDIFAAVWVDAIPVPAELVTRPLASSYELFAYALIDVPPNGTQVPQWFACTFADCPFAGPEATPGGLIYTPIGDKFAVFALNSHMHSRSKKYTIDLVDAAGNRITTPFDDQVDPETGEKHLYFTTEYDEPPERRLERPFLVRKGDQLRYACHYDNGVDQPVKLGCEEVPGEPPGRSVVEVFPTTGDLFAGIVRTCATDAECVGHGTGRCVPANLVYGHGYDDAMCGMIVMSWACEGDDVDACLALRQP